MTAPIPYRPVPIPQHLPQRLTISLWDFSWYVRTGRGEPFEDLDTAFAQAVERRYNTVRIKPRPERAVDAFHRSNAAPRHTMWNDIPLQQQCDQAFLAGSKIKTV